MNNKSQLIVNCSNKIYNNQEEGKIQEKVKITVFQDILVWMILALLKTSLTTQFRIESQTIKILTFS